MNYRRILTNYWKQFNPDYMIPKGFHVHHIIPRSCGGSDDANNLIALHPDDHASIHINRGDVKSGKFIKIAGGYNLWGNQHKKGKLDSIETKLKKRIAFANSEAFQKQIHSSPTVKSIEKGKATWKKIGRNLGNKNPMACAENRAKVGASKLGKKRYNNGFINKMFTPGNELDGFVIGGI